MLSIESCSLCKNQDGSSMYKYLSEMNLTRINNSFVKIILSLPNFSYPICHYNGGILTMDPKNFQTPLNSDLIFFQPVRIHMINMNNLEQIAASEMSKNPTIYFLREI